MPGLPENWLELLLFLLGGGAISKVLDWFLNRGSRKMQAVEKYQDLLVDTVNQLTKRVSLLEDEQVSLRAENDSLKAQLQVLRDENQDLHKQLQTLRANQ